MQRLSELRAAYVDMLVGLQPNLAITLGQGRSMTPLTFQSKAKHFINCVQRRCRGRAWAKWSKIDRPAAIGFLEHEHTNPHMHIDLWAPADLVPYFRNAESDWRKIRPCGDYYCDTIEDREGYAGYITKEFYRPYTHENIFIYC